MLGPVGGKGSLLGDLPTAIQRGLQIWLHSASMEGLGKQVAAVIWDVTRESSKVT